MDYTACYQDKYRSGKLTASAGVRSGGSGVPPATACPLEGGGSLGCLPPRLSPPRATRQHHAQSIRLTAVSFLLGTHPALGAVLSTPRPRQVPSVPRSSGYRAQSHPGAPDRACPPLPPQPLRYPMTAAPLAGWLCLSKLGALPTQNPVFLDIGGPYPMTAPSPRQTDCAKYSMYAWGAPSKNTAFVPLGARGMGARGSAVRRPLCPSDFPRGAPPAPPHGRGGSLRHTL